MQLSASELPYFQRLDVDNVSNLRNRPSLPFPFISIIYATTTSMQSEKYMAYHYLPPCVTGVAHVSPHLKTRVYCWVRDPSYKSPSNLLQSFIIHKYLIVYSAQLLEERRQRGIYREKMASQDQSHRVGEAKGQAQVLTSSSLWWSGSWVMCYVFKSVLRFVVLFFFFFC